MRGGSRRDTAAIAVAAPGGAEPEGALDRAGAPCLFISSLSYHAERLGHRWTAPGFYLGLVSRVPLGGERSRGVMSPAASAFIFGSIT